MNEKSADIIEAILKQMGFKTYRQTTYRTDDSRYDPNDWEIVITGLLDIDGHDVL